MTALSEITREEFALFWNDADDPDNEEEPLVIYPTEDEALGVAGLGDTIVMRRVLVVERVGEWEPNERQPDREGT